MRVSIRKQRAYVLWNFKRGTHFKSVIESANLLSVLSWDLIIQLLWREGDSPTWIQWTPRQLRFFSDVILFPLVCVSIYIRVPLPWFTESCLSVVQACKLQNVSRWLDLIWCYFSGWLIVLCCALLEKSIDGYRTLFFSFSWITRSTYKNALFACVSWYLWKIWRTISHWLDWPPSKTPISMSRSNSFFMFFPFPFIMKWSCTYTWFEFNSSVVHLFVLLFLSVNSFTMYILCLISTFWLS